MIVGLVKWFDKEKGFGIVQSVSGEQAFIHKSEFVIMPEKILVATALVYEIKHGRQGRLEAAKAQPPSSFEDWRLIMELLGKEDTVKIEVDITVRKRYGGTFRKKELKSYGIKTFAAHQLLRTKSKEDIISIITKYFKKFIFEKAPHLFYEYAILVHNKIKGLALPDEKIILKEIFSFFNENKNSLMLFQAWSNNNPAILYFEPENEFYLDHIFGLEKKEVEFPVKELTVSFFREISPLIKQEHIQRVKALEIGDVALFEIFSIRSELFIDNQQLDEYLFLTKIIDSISNEELKTKCNLILATYRNLIPHITEDKLLFEICNRFPANETCKSVIMSWHHQSSSLTIILFKKFKEVGYPFDNIEESFYSKFIDTAPLVELKTLLNIYSSKYLISRLIEKIDFSKDEPLHQLKDLENLTDHSSLLEDKIRHLLTDIMADFSYFKLKKTASLIHHIGKDFFSHELLNAIEQVSVEQLPAALAGYSNNEKISSFYVFSNMLDAFRHSKECLFTVTAIDKQEGIFEEFVLKNAMPAVIIRAWEQDYIPSFIPYLRSQLNEFTDEHLSNIFEKDKLEKELVNEILEIRLKSGTKVEWILQMAHLHLDSGLFHKFDKAVFQKIGKEEYFDLWKKGIGKIFPKDSIVKLITENSQEIYNIHNWIRDNICSATDIGNVLLEITNSIIEVLDRKDFYIKMRCIKCLVDLDINYKKKIGENNRQFDNLILWFLELNEEFDLALLQRKFIYFSPADQIKIIKRLFYLKHQRKISFSIIELDAIVRADLDLFLANQKFNEDFVLDVSTSLVIELIKNYQSQGRFLADSELLKIVLHDIGRERRKKFKIEKYFEECLGRMNAEWDWKTNGTIFKQQNGNNTFFVIEFDYDSNLVNEVKNIPGRRYDSNTKKWIIPSSSEGQVLSFGKKNRFFFNYGANNYSNNPHLANFKRDEVPNGIKFCEGRIANSQDAMLLRGFWWCANQKCFQNCETEHLSPESDYNSLTLLDLLKIFEINVDENSNYGFFPHGKYYQLISQINRFNRLLEKLYCHECDEILFPVQSSNFAAYTVVRFSCNNNNCKQHGQEVYLNHCLDGKCNSIIDSRISKKCENGLYICNCCGGCCSHDMLNRRLNNLRTTGGSIHPNLVDCVNGQKGHKEKNEYFCYNCSELMTEVIDDITGGTHFFMCLNCNVEYHPSSAIKRPHLHLRRANYPKIRLSQIRGNRNNQNPQSDYPDFDL
ncbi:cold shock domain-containing protein [Chitinophaga rhizophila]|uniref:Cold shock domain-containing protein n=1 Tax=Chitinophaga rhizophila TaxID=2866212 RepID=A0ABS7G9Y3_9BACT|nr:cold shock domain-containing protein [Chitinophaga rhizophila]MBW8683537.1 cold shock domain-containing protein [Chitinophaga rhizophila]